MINVLLLGQKYICINVGVEQMRDATFRYFKAVGDYVVEYRDLKHFTNVSLLLSICCSGVFDFF